MLDPEYKINLRICFSRPLFCRILSFLNHHYLAMSLFLCTFDWQALRPNDTYLRFTVCCPLRNEGVDKGAYRWWQCSIWLYIEISLRGILQSGKKAKVTLGKKYFFCAPHHVNLWHRSLELYSPIPSLTLCNENRDAYKPRHWSGSA